MDPHDRPQRVEITVSARTVLLFLGICVVVALVLLSLGSLLSIMLAAVVALGLDPVVAGLVARGWKRGRAALVVFAGLFASVFALVLVTAGPVWSEIEDFVHELPTYWDQLQETNWFQDTTSTAGFDDKVREGLEKLARELPEAATTLLGAAGGGLGSLLSLVP